MKTALANGHHIARNATLVLASTLTVMAGATIAPSLPAMEQHFSTYHNAQLWVQLVMTVPGLVIALIAPFVGWLLDRWQRKQLLILSTLLYAWAGAAGYWLDQSLLVLLLSRIFLGMAVAGVMVTCTTLVGDYFTGPQRGQYMGLLAAFGAFGGVVFVAVGTWLATISWQAPFLIYFLALAILPLLIMFIEEPKAVQRKDETTAAAPQGKPTSRRLLSFFFTLAFIEILVLYMVPVHLPFYLQKLNQANTAWSGFAIAWLLLVMAGVSIAYRGIQKLQSFPILHTVGCAVAASGCLFLGLSANYGQVLVALTVLGSGLGIMRPNLVVWLMASTAPEVRGRVMGGLTSSFFIGQFLCPLITLPIVQRWGYGPTFLAAGVVLAMAALALLGRVLLNQSVKVKACAQELPE